MTGNTTFDTQDSKFTDTRYKRDNIVRTYNEDNKLIYPHLLLSCDKIERFRVEVLKGMLKSPQSLHDDSYMDVYISLKGKLVHVGSIAKTALRSLLSDKVFGVFDKQIYINADTNFSGDMLYAFCEVKE